LGVTAKTVLFASQAAGIGLALNGSLVQAATGARLFYQAPEGCPERAAFVAAVQARGASFDGAAESSEVLRLLNVAIRREASGFSGTLELREGAQTSAPRAVHGRSCTEVSDALAVVTAMALQATPQGQAVPEPSPVTAAAAPALVMAPVISPPEPSPPAAREHATHVVRWTDDVHVEAGKLSLGYEAGYTLTAGAAFGVIPQLTFPRLDLTLSRTNLVTTPGNEDYLIGGIFRLRWTFLGAASHRSAGYETTVWGLKAGIGVCTPLTYDPQSWTINFCSEIAAGAMSLETKDASGSRTQQKDVGIGTASIELDTQYNLGSLFRLQLQLGGEMWATKLSAERPDGSQLFHSSVFNAYAMAGLGLKF